MVAEVIPATAVPGGRLLDRAIRRWASTKVAGAYAIKGDKAQATANYKKALDKVKAEDQRKRIQDELAKLK